MEINVAINANIIYPNAFLTKFQKALLKPASDLFLLHCPFLFLERIFPNVGPDFTLGPFIDNTLRLNLPICITNRHIQISRQCGILDITVVVSDNFPLGKLFVPRTCCVFNLKYLSVV